MSVLKWNQPQYNDYAGQEQFQNYMDKIKWFENRLIGLKMDECQSRQLQ